MKTIVVLLLTAITLFTCKNLPNEEGSDENVTLPGESSSLIAESTTTVGKPAKRATMDNVDTSKVNAISIAAQLLDAEIIETKIGKSFRPQILSDKDAVNYAMKNGKLVRVVVDLAHADTMVSRTFFYFDNDKLTFFKNREWHKESPPWAREVQIFYENGGIYFAMDRSVQLQPDQGPSPLMQAPLAECKMSDKALQQEHDHYWGLVKRALDEEMKKQN